jgi:hypothetical protein
LPALAGQGSQDAGAVNALPKNPVHEGLFVKYAETFTTKLFDGKFTSVTFIYPLAKSVLVGVNNCPFTFSVAGLGGFSKYILTVAV